MRWLEPVTVTLHVFFLSVEETPEHLGRLRRVDGPAKESAPAKSKLMESLLAVLNPIDRVAARVVG